MSATTSFASTPTSASRSSASSSVTASDAVSPPSIVCTVAATTAPVSMSTACSSLCARRVRPSFIFVIRASGSCGCSQSLFEPLFGRFRSSFARSSRVGVSIPEAAASCSSHSSYSVPSSRRTIVRMAALASSVVASTPSVLPLSSPDSRSRSSTKPKTAPCASTLRRFRVFESVECSGGFPASPHPRNSRSENESAHRHAIPRSEPSPSRYPTISILKYTPGGTPGRPRLPE